MKRQIAALAIGVGLAFAAAANDIPKKVVEIYRIAPGQHEKFLRLVAMLDAASVEAGLAPRELFVHQDGASWDFLFIQPAENTPEQDKIMNAALKRMGAPSGAKFFYEIRKYMAEHTDTFVAGPTTAAEWLHRLDQ
jgi:hypothetical protein